MKKTLGFELDTGTGWQVSFASHSRSQQVRIGLHFGGKEDPTHEVFVTKAELLQAIKELCGEKP